MTKADWERLGLIQRPTGAWWMRSHAMMPTPEHLEGSTYRVYFSGRDRDNRSHVGYVIVDLESPTDPVEICPQPVFSPGELGTFDDNGVTPSCVVDIGGSSYLYYVGWNPGSTVRVHLFGGLAVREGETFRRISRAPVIGRTDEDPFLNTAPFVMEHGSGRLIMFYVAGTGWDHPNLPRYHIKYAWSDDGIEWERGADQIAIDFEDGDETALARPWVVRDQDRYRMWFSSKRRGRYAIACAESSDGIDWHRTAGGLGPSEQGWDSQMVEYAAVVRHAGGLFMFYNGNDYGQDGFGIARSI